MPQKRQNKNLAYIKTFFYPRVGDFEIYYNRSNKYFQTKVNNTVFSGDSEQAVEKQAREHLDQITKLEWKPFIIIDRNNTGDAEHDTYFSGRSALRRKHSFVLHFWRLELAVAKDPRREGTQRIERRHPEDKHGDEYWSEQDEKNWVSGVSAQKHYEADEKYVYLDYDPAIWDTLMRMAQAMARQREALDKLLGSKNLEKMLLAQREKLPALPAPKRRRRA